MNIFEIILIVPFKLIILFIVAPLYMLFIFQQLIYTFHWSNTQQKCGDTLGMDIYVGYTFLEYSNISFGYSIRLKRFQRFDLFVDINAHLFEKGKESQRTSLSQGIIGVSFKYNGLKHPTQNNKILHKYDLNNNVVKNYHLQKEEVEVIVSLPLSEKTFLKKAKKIKGIIEMVKTDSLVINGEIYPATEIYGITSVKKNKSMNKTLTKILLVYLGTGILFLGILFYSMDSY
ncbi:MAG: hypothetical protein HQK83_11190 [Fibrobacteria bacterium]|nr:hypothetical protein [Fibrobacteria bacterium]